MKLVRDIYAAKRAAGQPVVSFEFFPPKTDEGDKTLFEKTIPALMELKPDFCSVTYGAGGSTRDKTLLIVDRIQKQHGLTAVAHLTCVNHTQAQVRELLAQIRALGVKNILALRGDPPGGGEFAKTPGGFEFSSELVKFIREQNGFSIGVAGLPEGHVACKAGKETAAYISNSACRRGCDSSTTRICISHRRAFALTKARANFGSPRR